MGMSPDRFCISLFGHEQSACSGTTTDVVQVQPYSCTTVHYSGVLSTTVVHCDRLATALFSTHDRTALGVAVICNTLRVLPGSFKFAVTGTEGAVGITGAGPVLRVRLLRYQSW